MQLTDAKGDWALITGASAGIGREFAMQLAKAGMSLVLVARRGELLEELSAELAEDHAIKILPLAVDLTATNACTEIRDRLGAERIKIRLLVNNAALGHWGHFTERSPQFYEQMIRLNIVAPVNMCHLFADDLASHPSSAIINVSSQAAYNPIPFMAVYAASKAFVSSFSQALHGEWQERGILVQTLVPGPTATEFDSLAGAPAFADKNRVGADQVVRPALAHLSAVNPLVSNAKGLYKQRLFAALAPAKFVIKTVGQMFRPPTT